MNVSLSCTNVNNMSYLQCSPAFGHHPDFDRLVKTRPVNTSDWFRRGMVIYVGNFEKYWDIVNICRNIFTKNIQQPIKMLIAGVADSQEPFSYLTTIKTIIGNRPIKDVLDLHIIDLRSKPNEDELFLNSYLIDETPPVFANEGFVFDPHPKYPLFNYRAKDELFEYLVEVYNNPDKAKWETRLQEEIINYPENYFGIISANNVLYYLKDGEISPTYNTMCDKVNSGGYIITEADTYDFDYKNRYNFIRSKAGIYQKK